MLILITNKKTDLFVILRIVLYKYSYNLLIKFRLLTGVVSMIANQYINGNIRNHIWKET